MNIGSLVLHSCIRSHKISWLLMEKGHSVSLITERPMEVHGWVDFNSCNLIYTGHLEARNLFKDQLWSTMKTLAPVLDLVYYSNEPDWCVEVIRDAIGPNKPIIYDIHDMVSQRTGTIDIHQKAAEETANGFMVPSRAYKEIVQQRNPGKPVYEVLSCVPEKLFPKQRRVPSRRGVVYEGGLKGQPKEISEQFEFRNWADAFTAMSKANVEVWCYSAATGEDLSNYEHSGAIMMPSLPYEELLKNLSSHEAGLVGSPFPHKAFDGALPNKLFEYIAAGIPIIAMNAPDVSDFIAACGFGVTVKSPEEIPDALEKIRNSDMREAVWENRVHWTMERQIGKVETLFNKVCIEANFDQHGAGEVG